MDIVVVLGGAVTASVVYKNVCQGTAAVIAAMKAEKRKT